MAGPGLADGATEALWGTSSIHMAPLHLRTCLLLRLARAWRCQTGAEVEGLVGVGLPYLMGPATTQPCLRSLRGTCSQASLIRYLPAGNVSVTYPHCVVIQSANLLNHSKTMIYCWGAWLAVPSLACHVSVMHAMDDAATADIPLDTQAARALVSLAVLRICLVCRQ